MPPPAPPPASRVEDAIQQLDLAVLDHQHFLATHPAVNRSEEHTSELQSHRDLVCRLLLEKNNQTSCDWDNSRTKKKAANSRLVLLSLTVNVSTTYGSYMVSSPCNTSSTYMLGSFRRMLS